MFREDRVQLIALFEIVALEVNSGSISRQVAYQMFGYYAIKCYDAMKRRENKGFWLGLESESYDWDLFRWFAEEMVAIDQERKRGFDIKRCRI